ncbi:hypothetical protein FH972_023989 [Carpinus fangiana]|uniref:REJ domain-containing protein n=1 Tax=Carpinus fangiana TaxID=176857 RepID=A0A5N6KX18_9ROSI|nr:hypothetical protein FH972_023989 [Carpinus fangiana]
MPPVDSRDPEGRPAASSSARPSGHLASATQRSLSEAMPPTSHSTDSWIEISSQPSSSSLSSVAGDEIVTTGLRVQHEPATLHRRRRTLPSSTRFRLHIHEAAAGEGSSQDEYEESGSESDRVLTSSNEALPHRAPASTASADAEDEDSLEDDEDESATALGIPSNQSCFTPQPNAFSHPPSSSRNGPDSYFASTSASRPHQRSSRQSHSPLTTSSYHADHDAALRASLSTLLSCAAAARGLPKPYTGVQPRAPTSNRIELGTLRMLPESALTGVAPDRPRSSSASSSRSADKSRDRNKRKSPSRSSSKERALANKKLRAEGDGGPVSPTLLTWVVSAGVLVLVSALSFGAGYSVGRETGHMEAGGLLGPTPTVGEGCAKEAAIRGGSTGLRRFRWTGTAASAVAAGA